MKITNIKGFSIPSFKVLTVCACCLFLLSVLFPFLTVSHYSIIEEDAYRVTYWSHKATIRYIGLRRQASKTLFFSTYWFAQEKPYSYPTLSSLGVSWALVAMFSTQILTLGFGLGSLFTHRKSVQLLPLISCVSTTFLVAYTMTQVQSQTYGLPKYEVGYWLCFPTTILFLCIFILHLTTK